MGILDGKLNEVLFAVCHHQAMAQRKASTSSWDDKADVWHIVLQAMGRDSTSSCLSFFLRFHDSMNSFIRGRLLRRCGGQ